MSGEFTTAAEAQQPLLRVTKGIPDREELAALAAVLARFTTGEATATRPQRTVAQWRRPEREQSYNDPRTWRCPRPD